MAENDRDRDISYDGLEDLPGELLEDLERCPRPEDATRRVIFPFGDTFGLEGGYTGRMVAVVARPMLLDALIVPRMYARCFSVSMIAVGCEQLFRADPPIPLLSIDLSDHRDSIVFWFPEPVRALPGHSLELEVRNNLPNDTLKFAGYWLGRILPREPCGRHIVIKREKP